MSARDEFFRIIDEIPDINLTEWQEQLVDRLFSGVPEWDVTEPGDVLPDGSRRNFHVRIDRSAARKLNIGRH